MIQYQVFKRPDTGGYWVLDNGVAKEISGDVRGLFGSNIPVRNFGEGSAGWSPQYGGGTTGGNISAQQYKQNVQNQYENQLPNEALQSYTDADIQNPNYTMVQKGGNAKLLVPNDKLQDFLGAGYQQVNKPAPTSSSYTPPSPALLASMHPADVAPTIQNQGMQAAGVQGQVSPQAPQIDPTQQRQWDIVTGGTKGAFTGSPEQLQILQNAGFGAPTGSQSSQGQGTQEGGVTGEIQGSSGGAGGTQPPNINTLKQQLTSLGINTTGLSDQQIQTLGMMRQIQIMNADKNKGIVPPSLSQADMDKYLADAHANLDPYYQELLTSGKQDLMQQIAMMTGEAAQLEQQQKTDFQLQQEQLAQQEAEAGLARSGLRNLAQQRLTQQQEGLVSSQRRQLGSQVYGLGSQFERQFGTKALQGAGIPQVQFGGQNISYQPQGGMLGQLGKEQVTAVIQQQQQAAGQELQKRYARTYPQFISQ